MAITNGTQMATVKAGNGSKVAPGLVGAKVRVFVENVTLASQSTGASNAIRIARVPAGARFLGVDISTTVSLGSSTIKIGDSGNDDRFMEAATYTVVDTRLSEAVAENIGYEFTEDTDILLEVGAAALPASGTLSILFYYTDPN